MADCGWSNSIPTKCRRIDYDSIVLTVDHVEKTFELLNHHRLRRSRLSRPFDHREILSRVAQTMVIAHIKASQQPGERVAIRRRSGYNAVACI
jgi:hypothetical protein